MNPWSAGPINIRDPIWVNILSVDDLALHGSMPVKSSWRIYDGGICRLYIACI